MEKDKIIQSFTVKSGNHTYYIDVQSTADHRKYLSLTELRRLPEGYHERQRVVLFEESIPKVVTAIQAALEQFPLQSQSSIETLKEKYPNAYQPWTREDDRRLELMYFEGKPASEIATLFQRNPGAITARIEKLDLRHKCN